MSSAFVDINRTLQALGMSDAPLQVSCLPSLALQWLMPRLSEFHRQQPNVPVRVKAEFQVLDRQAMETDDIDVAVRYDPVQYDRLHAEAILDEILFPVATPAYLAQHPALPMESRWTASSVARRRPWAARPEFVEWRTWLEEVRPAWAADLDGPQFNFSSLAITAALNHQGVAMGRGALVHDEIASGRLVDVFGKHVRAPARYCCHAIPTIRVPRRFRTGSRPNARASMPRVHVCFRTEADSRRRCRAAESECEVVA